jgi:gliding motility-associated lipoprotein GldH
MATVSMPMLSTATTVAMVHGRIEVHAVTTIAAGTTTVVETRIEMETITAVAVLMFVPTIGTGIMAIGTEEITREEDRRASRDRRMRLVSKGNLNRARGRNNLRNLNRTLNLSSTAMIRLLRNSVLCVFAVCFAACHGDGVIYHSYHSMGEGGWKKNDTLLYQVPPTDSLHAVRLYVELRNALNYQYADFYVVVRQNMADSLTWQTDTVHFQLADSSGKWLGKGGVHYRQNAMFVRDILLPRHPFHATIRASQGMKDDVIKGITDVGFRIEDN